MPGWTTCLCPKEGEVKKYTFVVAGTTSSVKHYLPIPDGGKLAGIYAVVNSTQTAGTALVK